MTAARKKGRRLVRGTRAYYTIIVKGYGNKWYPNEPVGHAFHEISRGTFKTKTEARAWARAHLGGGKYRIKAIYH